MGTGMPTTPAPTTTVPTTSGTTTPASTTPEVTTCGNCVGTDTTTTKAPTKVHKCKNGKGANVHKKAGKNAWKKQKCQSCNGGFAKFGKKCYKKKSCPNGKKQKKNKCIKLK